jgi:hypothetical protein
MSWALMLDTPAAASSACSSKALDGQTSAYLPGCSHRDQRDEENAAEKVGDMSGFYGNLLTKNVAFGTSG